MLAEPDVVDEKVAEQLAVPTVAPATSEHGLPVKEPPVTPVCAKVTLPVGVRAVPAIAVSVTVAVHEEDAPVATLEGEHATLVVVVRRLTVTLVAALVLPE